jgi:hypothetical protein
MIDPNRQAAGPGSLEGLGALANDKAWLVHRGRFLDVAFLLEVGDVAYLVRIRRGRVEAVDKDPLRHAALDLRTQGLAGGLGDVLAADPAAGFP